MALSIQHTRVKSSVIKTIGYTESYGGLLEIWFKEGAFWRYKNVPPVVHDQLMAARSKGSYYANYIKGRYVGQHLGGRPKDVI